MIIFILLARDYVEASRTYTCTEYFNRTSFVRLRGGGEERLVGRKYLDKNTN